MDDELAVRGIEISIDDYSEKGRRVCHKAGHWSTASYIRDIWLFYSVSKEVIGHWPTIREWLTSVGFKREELITLGLSKMLKPVSKNTLRKRKRVGQR